MFSKGYEYGEDNELFYCLVSFEKRKTRPVSKPPLPTTVDDVYMSFDEVHVDVHVSGCMRVNVVTVIFIYVYV